MSPADRLRRVSAEISWRSDPWAVAWVGRRTIYHYWPLLAPYFRDVFLPPHRRAEEEGVAWNWSEPSEEAPFKPAELATLRKRLAGDREAFADFVAGGRHSIEQDSVEQLDHVVGQTVRHLMEKSDAELASFACRTEAGVRLHSWGASAPAPRRYPGDEHEPATVETASPPEEPRPAPVKTARPVWVRRSAIAALALLGLFGAIRFFRRSDVAEPAAAGSARSAKPSPAESAPVAGARPDATTTPPEANPKRSGGGGSGAGVGVGAGARSSRSPRPLAALPPAETDPIALPAGSGGGGGAPGADSEMERDVVVPGSTTKPGAIAGASSGAGVGAGVASSAAGQPALLGGVASGAILSRSEDAPNQAASKAATTPSPSTDNAQPDQKRLARERAGADLAKEPSSEETAKRPGRTAVATNPDSARPTTETARDQPAAKDPPPTPATTAKATAAVAVAAASRPFDTETRADAETATRPRASRKRRITAAASEPAALADEAPPGAAGRRFAVSLPEVNLDRVVTFALSPWRPRLLADTIVPTTPMPIGRAQSVAAIRETMMTDKLAQLPAAFRRPTITCGFALKVRADSAEAGLRWQHAEGAGDAATTRVRGERAEIGWPAERPPAGTLSVLRTAAGVVLAEIRGEPNAGPTLRVREDVEVSAWISLGDEAARAARFEWQSAFGVAFAPNQHARDDTGHTLTLPITDVAGSSLPRGVALVDRDSGWALAAELDVRVQALNGR